MNLKKVKMFISSTASVFLSDKWVKTESNKDAASTKWHVFMHSLWQKECAFLFICTDKFVMVDICCEFNIFHLVLMQDGLHYWTLSGWRNTYAHNIYPFT